jgi:hypothetical protein
MQTGQQGEHELRTLLTGCVLFSGYPCLAVGAALKVL